MTLPRRTLLVPLIALGTAVAAAAAGLAVGGTPGAVLAAGVLVSGTVAASALVLRRRQREHERLLRGLADAVAAVERTAVNTRSRHISLSERLDARFDETRRAVADVRLELAAAERRAAERHAQARNWAEVAKTRHEALADRAGRIAAAVEEARAEGELRGRANGDAVATQARRVYGKVEDLLALYYDVDPGRALPHTQGWAAGVDLARYLYLQVREHGRTRVLECGSGSSTVLFAYALRAIGSGRAVALEHEPRFAEATRGMLRERGLEDWAEVVDAPLTEVPLAGETWRWYDPQAVPAGEFDLLVVDGPPGSTGPQARYPAVPVLYDRLASGALVVLDDAFRPEERATAERWAAEFDGFEPERIGHERGTIVLRKPTGA
ncbi:class I SAM-dependent methyltransferase [Glycomyces sp. NPDC047369]